MGLDTASPGATYLSRTSHADVLYTLFQATEFQPISLEQLARPSDATLALCALYANRWHNPAKWTRAEAYFEVPQPGELSIFDDRQDKLVGLRMVTFVSRTVQLGGHKAVAVVYSFRGTRLHHSSNLAADYHVLADRDQDLVIVQKAVQHIGLVQVKLRAAYPDVQLCQYTTGHSLGGFTATACTVLLREIHHCVAFECPGLTSYYHSAAAAACGNEDVWKRIHTKLHVQTDVMHVLKCLLGTGIRLINWIIVAHLVLKLLHLAFGITISAWTCLRTTTTTPLSFPLLPTMRRAPPPPHPTPTPPITTTHAMHGDGDSYGDGDACEWEMAVAPAHLVLSVYWTLKTASAYLAGRLGMSFTQLFDSHAMWNIVQAFDFVTGRPQRCTTMASWPRMSTLRHSFTEYARRLLLESFFPTACAEGVKVMFDRNCMIESRIRALPGYVEATTQGPPHAVSWLLGGPRSLASSLWGVRHVGSLGTGTDVEGVSPSSSWCEGVGGQQGVGSWGASLQDGGWDG